jgi:GNAT superfamily N-acetyltransferase/nitroimidazol reductase NimA-like FMN-containing flavoprotein (pyridoxamine 5'-phosphate oxidase superfamily)
VKRDLGDGYELDDDRERIDRDAVHRYLGEESYWARARTREVVDALVDGAARVAGLYHEGRQVGFSRTLSDGHVQSYLADVYVLEEHRGRGLGVELVRFSVDEGPLARTKWLLHTADAHDLYRKFGFIEPGERLLERASSQRRPDAGPSPTRIGSSDEAAPSARRPSEEEVAALLELDVPARLATVGSDGFPRVTPIWFMWEGGTFSMTSVEDARHVTDLRRDPRAGICVDVEATDPDPSGVRPNASVKAWGACELEPDTGGRWTRRITEKYVPGEIGLRRAEYRARMPRIRIELRPVGLVATATVEPLPELRGSLPGAGERS